jgi:hypothetical protein
MNILKALDETELFLRSNESSIPKDVHSFLVEICKSEREYVARIKSLHETKGVFKVAEPRLMEY